MTVTEPSLDQSRVPHLWGQVSTCPGASQPWIGSLGFHVAYQTADMARPAIAVFHARFHALSFAADVRAGRTARYEPKWILTREEIES